MMKHRRKNEEAFISMMLLQHLKGWATTIAMSIIIVVMLLERVDGYGDDYCYDGDAPPPSMTIDAPLGFRKKRKQ